MSRKACAGRMEGPSWKISYLKTEANHTNPFFHVVEILHNLDVSKRQHVKYPTIKSECCSGRHLLAFTFWSEHQVPEGLIQFVPNSENDYLLAQMNVKFILF